MLYRGFLEGEFLDDDVFTSSFQWAPRFFLASGVSSPGHSWKNGHRLSGRRRYESRGMSPALARSVPSSCRGFETQSVRYVLSALSSKARRVRLEQGRCHCGRCYVTARAESGESKGLSGLGSKGALLSPGRTRRRRPAVRCFRANIGRSARPLSICRTVRRLLAATRDLRERTAIAAGLRATSSDAKAPGLAIAEP